MLTASFAALVKNKVMADCDVDAADLHLMLHPEIRERYAFQSGRTAFIVKDLCTECGECSRICRFEAIRQDFTVDPVSCEGCGVCSHICPAGAVRMDENTAGEWFISDTRYGTMVHARLGIAEENSGRLVTRVRQAASDIADKEQSDYIIIDGPPGIGCPVIASLTGVDLAVIVTEPTISGIHDMERVLEVTTHFHIPAGVVINKYDINLKNTEDILFKCRTANIEVMAKIPFSRKVSESVVLGVPFPELYDDQITEEISGMWEKIRLREKAFDLL
jgi:MinD superfamily P-loop ATPase